MCGRIEHVQIAHGAKNFFCPRNETALAPFHFVYFQFLTHCVGRHVITLLCFIHHYVVYSALDVIVERATVPHSLFANVAFQIFSCNVIKFRFHTFRLFNVFLFFGLLFSVFFIDYNLISFRFFLFPFPFLIFFFVFINIFAKDV